MLYTKYIRQKGFVELLIIGIVLLLAVAGGAYYFGTQKSQAPVTSSPSPIAQVSLLPTPIPDETANPDSIGANWKTYTNTSYKYSIQYPRDWELLKSSDLGASFRPIGKENNFPYGAVRIEVRDKTIKDEILSLKEYLEQVVGDETSPSRILESIEQINTGYKVKWRVGAVGSIGKEETSTSAYFNLPGKLIEINWVPREEEVKLYQPIFDQILSTFKFTR